MQGLFPEGIELRLVDLSGEVVNRWPLDFFAVWPDPKHVFPATEVPVNDLHYDTQGVWLNPDGSVLVNFSLLGLAKFNRCGELQWKLDRRTHHSITPNPDGSFWVPAKRDVREVPESVFLEGVTREKLLQVDGRYEDLLLLVSSDGTVRRELSVLKALVDGLSAAALYDIARMSRWDPTHVNDIEVVTPTLAARIDGVDAGDLLISIRQMHMLAILDEVTGVLNWWRRGPGVRQHDPDISETGEIEIFSNGTEDLAVNGVRGSSIISFDPATGLLRTIYPVPGEHFFSRIMGRHQVLPNGNRLITESMAGRVFEIDGDGKVVWTYVGRYDETHATVIEEAIRFDENYFTVDDWRCPAPVV
jgi:hypothetical protein